MTRNRGKASLRPKAAKIKMVQAKAPKRPKTDNHVGETYRYVDGTWRWVKGKK